MRHERAGCIFRTTTTHRAPRHCFQYTFALVLSLTGPPVEGERGGSCFTARRPWRNVQRERADFAPPPPGVPQTDAARSCSPPCTAMRPALHNRHGGQPLERRSCLDSPPPALDSAVSTFEADPSAVCALPPHLGPGSAQRQLCVQTALAPRSRALRRPSCVPPPSSAFQLPPALRMSLRRIRIAAICLVTELQTRNWHELQGTRLTRIPLSSQNDLDDRRIKQIRPLIPPQVCQALPRTRWSL